jgi:hypothetical protein
VEQKRWSNRTPLGSISSLLHLLCKLGIESAQPNTNIAQMISFRHRYHKDYAEVRAIYGQFLEKL